MGNLEGKPAREHDVGLSPRPMVRAENGEEIPTAKLGVKEEVETRRRGAICSLFLQRGIPRFEWGISL